MKPIERRIMNIEAAYSPSASTIYLEHAEEDPEFERKLSEAKAGGVRVLVGHSDWEPKRSEVIDGVEHMNSISAYMTYLAKHPSEGREFIKAIQGRSIVPGTFSQADHEVDDAY